MEKEEILEEALQPFAVVNVSMVFPGELDENNKPVAKTVFIFEPATGQVQYSQVVVNEIASAIEAARVILIQSLNPKNEREDLTNVKQKSDSGSGINFGFQSIDGKPASPGSEQGGGSGSD